MRLTLSHETRVEDRELLLGHAHSERTWRFERGGKGKKNFDSRPETVPPFSL